MVTPTQAIRERLEDPGAPPFRSESGERWVVHVDATPTAAEAFAHSVARGLSDARRWLHCRYLYDAAGSELFVEITRQPEYYPTRAEAEILEARADEIRERVGSLPLIELGAGTAAKTRALLAAWSAAAEGPVEYVPVDIDPTVLTSAARALAAEFSGVRVTGLATSYERALDILAGASPMCLVFLGSTIGNLNPGETDLFLARLERALAPGDALLLGVDLVKDVATLEAAYNDAAGVSQAFTRNLFVRMNRELGTHVPPDAVDHVAYWNDRLERIEIYARFTRAARIDLRSIGRSFRVAPGEMILTEISRKYRIDQIESDLARFGFRLESAMTDAGRRFALLLSRRADEPAGPPAWTRYAALLQAVRRRTLDLIDPLDEERLARQVAPFLSPIAWDLAHIAEFEELWLVRTVDRLESAGRSGDSDPPGLEPAYDAIRTPRSERGALELPPRDDVLRRMRRIRAESLRRLRRVDFASAGPLVADGLVYRLLACHEAQHQETILQAIALMDDEPYEPAFRAETPRPTLPPDSEMLLVPEGSFPLGARPDGFAYDNERPLHWVDQPAFWIDAAPVTNGAFLRFVEAGGYDAPQAWSEAGRAWRRELAEPWPLGWRRTAGGGWEETHFGRVEPLVPTRPVARVSWFEADAFARWSGKRLPTEAEWEKAAAWDPEVRVKRRWPWGDEPPDAGRANLDAVAYMPAPVGAYPAGRSFYGAHQLVGDVWEWTASRFEPYPGFEAFPYPEYSEVHFGGDYYVLRGGSWATASIVASSTFRNWDHPQRRQIFAGFRCARDV